MPDRYKQTNFTLVFFKEHKLLYLLFTFFYFFFIFSIQAQTTTKIHGKIFNSKTKHPLQGATIILSKQNIATSSAQNGEFVICSNNNKQKLIISYVGFEKHTINIHKIQTDTFLNIYLSPKDVKIKNVIVNPRQATTLIEKALLQIPNNYPTIPMSFTAFFSETITQDDSIIMKIESFIEIYKAPYNSKQKDKMKFLQARILKDEKDIELWDYLYFVNSPFELLYSDIAKYPNDFIQIPTIKVNFLKEQHYKFYEYKVSSSEDHQFFIIEFFPNPNKRRGIFKGKIIIEKQNYAIISLEYEYAEDKINRVNNFPSETEISLSNIGVNIPDISFYSKIDYKKLNGKWHINSVVIEYSFLFQVGKQKNAPVITVRDELKILEVKTDNINKIKFLEKIFKDTKLIEQLPETDSIFWKFFDSNNAF